MMVKKPEPSYVFEVPWHAEVFALTVHLSEKGHFGWTEWTRRLSKNLKYTKKNEV
ncbi:nitrile hydratase accessory protein [Candidatus Puniceispirillum sp.]|nr:nitrile hydratase accessory protein [Candidatus Puniceispirillum sp.]